MQENLDKIIPIVSDFGLRAFSALVIFIIGKWLARIVSGWIKAILNKAKVEEIIVTFVDHLSYMAILTFVLIAALGKLGIQTASFVAVLGAAGLAVGLALQGSLANFAAGIMIVLFKPFKSGHFITAGGESGTVKEINIFNTVLSKPDNVKVIVPNSQITAGNIVNYSANPTRRVDLVVGVSYEDDLRKAKEVITQVLKKDPQVLKDPVFVVAVSELAESSVNLVVRPWVNAADYWDVYFRLTENIKLALDQNGITIPFPQRDIHIKTTAAVTLPGEKANV